jgi:hypothetical protein
MKSNLTRVIRSELGKHEHSHRRLVALLDLSPRSISDRMTGKTDWRWHEIALICAAYPELLKRLAACAAIDGLPGADK